MAKVKKPTAEALTVAWSFRLNRSDDAVARANVTASGMTKSRFLREAVIANRTEIVAVPVTSEDKKQMIYVANKASVNLHHLAHRASADHAAGIIDRRTYLDILDRLDDISANLKAAI
jgi:hypothetical protein